MKCDFDPRNFKAKYWYVNDEFVWCFLSCSGLYSAILESSVGEPVTTFPELPEIHGAQSK